MDKFVIWGTGNCCKMLIEKYGEIVSKVDFFVDKNPEKQGTQLIGKTIYSPEYLKGQEEAYDIVVAVYDLKIVSEVQKWVRQQGFCNYVFTWTSFIKLKTRYDGLREEISRHLQDQQSKVIFDKRCRTFLEDDWRYVYDMLFGLERENGVLPVSEDYAYDVTKDLISILKEQRLLQGTDKRTRIVLCGITRESKALIEVAGVKIDAFLRVGDEKPEEYGCFAPEITLEECIASYKDAYILQGKKGDEAIVRALAEAGFSREQMLRRTTVWRSQYFDELFLEPDRGGVFVDAGVLDLNNTFDYIKWCGEDFEKIYAFEPGEESYQFCKCRLEKEDKTIREKINLINAATWSKDTTLRFDGYKVVEGATEGDVTEARSIDSVLQGERVTYLKMDVEGAELETLKGAAETIKRWRPKLAICVYHKQEDILELPQYILSLVPDYKMYLRHYSTCWAETVLYCM